MKKITIVLPIYNEERNIQPFCEALYTVIREKLSGYDCETIWVDDGSSDQSLERLRSCAKDVPGMKIIHFSRNFGHQAALTAGLTRATGDLIITMDSDFQDPPELLPEMVRKWEEGNRVVYARRVAREDTFFKKWSAEMYYRLLGVVSDVNIPRQVGDFRLMDRVVLDNLLKLDEHARYLRGMIAWLGFKHDFVDFERPNRLHGETHYPLRKMLKLAMDGLLNFSFLPLKVGFWVGCFSILLSGLFLTYMVIDKLLHPHIEYPLFKWLTVILLGFVGAQFMLIWIIGEYVGRIYNDVRRRPLYVVAEEINFEPPVASGD